MKRFVFPLIILAVSLILKIDSVREQIFIGDRAYPYLDALFWFFLVFCIIRLVDFIFVNSFSRQKLPFPLPKVLHSIILAVLYLAAFFAIIRGFLNFNITPFLATSALLTMIIGLALQGVLSNLLSGMSLHFTKSFNKGDWIEVGDEEGVVIDTNWRETRIFNRESNIVVIPNNTMASNKITNFTYPNKKTAITIPVKAGYSASPTSVFAALREAAADVPEVLERPAPEAHLLEYLDFGVSYLVKFWISDFNNKYLIMAQVGKNIWYKFKRRNIEIPVPLTDKLQDIFGFQKELAGVPPEEVGEDRVFRSLLESNFLRYQEGEKEGELLVTEEEVRELARSVKCHHYAQGEVVFRQGDQGDSCYIIASGRIKGEIHYQEKNKTYSSDFSVGKGRLFGEMSLLTGMPRTATGVVEQDAELLKIKSADFARLLERNPALADVIAELTSHKNKNNQEFLGKIKDLSKEHIQDSMNKHSILNRLKRFISG